jgi:UDP-N-acetylglucosamine acyltransferase
LEIFSLSMLIHPTAIVHPLAELDPTVAVGAFTIIGAGVKIGAATQVGDRVTIEGLTEIGKGNRIFANAVIGGEPQDLKYKGADSLVKIGDNNVIRECVTVNRATGEGEVTQIGNGNLLMACVHIAHNCLVEDDVVIANNVALAGHVKIESKVTIGGVLGVHQFVHIGKMAMVGGMSRIDRDVPPFMLVEGNPAKVRSLNFVGLKRKGLSVEEISELKEAFRLLYKSKFSFTEAVENLHSLGDGKYIQHLQSFLKLSLAGGKRRGAISGI